MYKSWYDKLGFMDKIFEPLDIIIDFGCADGSITKIIKHFYPNVLVIGYDTKEIIETVESTRDEIIYTDNIHELTEYAKQGKSLLILNSVLNEIFNYSKDSELDEIFSTIFTSNIFNYIWIRDMCICRPFANTVATTQWMDNIKRAIESSDKYSSKYREFTKIYGDINSCENMIHFLMKCRYESTWGIELIKDYTKFARNYYSIQNQIMKNYKITYEEYYTLPYIEWINRQEFGVSIKNTGMATHLKTLYQKK
jgi:23S rRNA U2552 (ribose-2'-O)-methylase RlmE/FtsJ